MTENEISELLYNLRKYAAEYNLPPFGKEIDGTVELLKQATDTIEELQKYRMLGTVEFLADMKRHYVEVLSDLRQYQNLGTIKELKELTENKLSGLELAEIYAAVQTLKKYQEIGTVEECHEAREKQIAKTPIELYLCGKSVSGCPACKKRIGIQQKYCECCGQKVDWS